MILYFENSPPWEPSGARICPRMSGLSSPPLEDQREGASPASSWLDNNSINNENGEERIDAHSGLVNPKSFRLDTLHLSWNRNRNN